MPMVPGPLTHSSLHACQCIAKYCRLHKFISNILLILNAPTAKPHTQNFNSETAALLLDYSFRTKSEDYQVGAFVEELWSLDIEEFDT